MSERGNVPVCILDLTDREINEYEQIILCSIASYLRVHPMDLNISQWYDISSFLCISANTIEKILDSVCENNEFIYSYLSINGKIIDLSEHWQSYELFECLLNYYFIRNCIKQTSINNEKEILLSNYKLYQSATHNMNMMNVHSGSYECSYKQYFSKEYAPQSFENFHPSHYLDALKLYLFDEYFDQNKSNLQMLYRIINYQIISHANAMYLIVVSQILKHSIFYNNSTRYISEELYNNLRFLLKDARVISIQTNQLFQDMYKNHEERNKHKDNTTRLHILYGFDNYDSYSLRLDLSHQGVGWIHFNNNSPGGVRSYFFSKCEYNSIIKDMPSLNMCFINYGDKYFLKEKCNCTLNREEKALFELVQKQKEHAYVFKNTYSEKNVVEFLSVINYFLFNLSTSNIDKNGENAKYSFNFDKLMSWLELYYICRTSSDTEGANKFAELILSRAINYGIISSSDEKEFLSDEGIQLIIDLAYDRCFQKK